jgi:hypothetical protein
MYSEKYQGCAIMQELCYDTKEHVFKCLSVTEALRLHFMMGMKAPSQKEVSQHMLKSCNMKSKKGAHLRAMSTADLNDIEHYVRALLPHNRNIDQIVKEVLDDLKDHNLDDRRNRITHLYMRFYWLEQNTV